MARKLPHHTRKPRFHPEDTIAVWFTTDPEIASLPGGEFAAHHPRQPWQSAWALDLMAGRCTMPQFLEAMEKGGFDKRTFQFRITFKEELLRKNGPKEKSSCA